MSLQMFHNPWILFVLLLSSVSVILSFGACTFESTHLGSVQCTDEGARQGELECRGGYWVGSVDLDARIDAEIDVPVDTETDIDECIPLGDDALCADQAKDCGAVETVDNCGHERTLSCGTCTAPEICHDDNRCACASQSIAELCAAEGAQCGEIIATDACGRERTAPCGPCPGENQSCVDNQCCQGESDAELCAEEPAIECGLTTVTDQCGAEREVDCGACSGDGFWQSSGASYACCSEDDEDLCDCQDETFLVPTCANNTCTTRVDDERITRSGCDTCAGLSCPDWSECSYNLTCVESGTKTRTCTLYACDDGVCSGTEQTSETSSEGCVRDQTGTSCNPNLACSTGTCASGECDTQPICTGSNTNCGCNTCQDCTALNGPQEVGPWAGCCVDGQACECRTVENREYTCSGTTCDFTVASTGTATRNCADCTADHCDEWPAASACEYETTCSRTGSLTRNCYTYACPETGTACAQTTTPETQQDAPACDRNTTNNDCDVDGGSMCDGKCNGSGQCVEPTCDGTLTSCGTCGNCSNCTDQQGRFFQGDEYDCCRENGQLCRCQDYVDRVVACVDGDCDIISETPGTEQTGCGGCGGGNSCRTVGDADCCTANNAVDVCL
ncbi:MAG: hypothetical protein ACNA8W_13260 [Bradymonadaceae bacterium]